MNSNLRDTLQDIPIPYLIADQELQVLWKNKYAADNYSYLFLDGTLEQLLFDYDKDEVLYKMQNSNEALTLGCRLPMLQTTITLSPIDDSDEILVSLTAVPDRAVGLEGVVTSFNKSLQAPLCGLLGSISMLKYNLDEEYSPQLNKMVKDCYRMLRSSMSISEYFSQISGCSVLDLKVHYIVNFLKQQLEPTAIMLKHMGIKLNWSLPEEDVPVSFDESKISIVLFSLLSNSCSYGESNNEINVSLSCNEKYVRVSISDHGYGIPAELISRVMEPYYSRGLDEDERPGIGLGLPLSKAIIDQHGGSFAIQSIQDSGTTVAFSLPLHRESEDGQSAPLAATGVRYGNGPYSKRNIFLSTVLPEAEYE